jgi:hypothetical protein
MKRPKREHLRPIKNAGFADKKFTRVLTVKKRINREKLVHPLIVIADLRRGSIGSLDRYLLKTKGVIDRAVALELRKLISGTIQRTKFRLIVVEHPNKPKDKGGRPKTHMRKPSAKAFAVADEFDALREHGQVKTAVEDVAKENGISTSTVYKYARDVAQYQNAKPREKAEPLKSLFGPVELQWGRRDQHELESDKQALRRAAARKAYKGDEKKEDE